jgi:phosphatidylglycerophosphate synthase
MKMYTYNTSEKSYLDKIHDSYWDSSASFMAASFPWITPNIVTLTGVFPIFILFGLYIAQIINPVLAYTWLVPALIFYVNMDAIDGKLARLTNKSSPYGQLVDHGCDSISIGCITFMLLGHYDYLEISLNYRILVFFAMISIYIAQMMCNITEFYTGSMIVSLGGNVGTTELIYTSAIVSFILSRLYALEIETLAYLIQIVLAISVVLGALLFSFYVLNTLYNPIIGSKRKGSLNSEGTENNIKIFAPFDIGHYILTTGLSLLIVHLSDFSICEIALSIVYLSSSMIDIIFSNGIKKDTILFDELMLNLQGIKCVLLILFGSGFITIFIDSVCISQFFFNKIQKRDYIFKKYNLN